MRNSRTDGYLIATAGVYFIASELNRRGLIALPTMRNARFIDIIVTNADGTWHANLKVRTKNSRVSSWPIGTHFTKPNRKRDWYAFVRYLKNESRFEVFIESAERAEKQSIQNSAHIPVRGYGYRVPSWYLPRNHAELERVRRQWREFGPAQKTS